MSNEASGTGSKYNGFGENMGKDSNDFVIVEKACRKAGKGNDKVLILMKESGHDADDGSDKDYVLWKNLART